MKKLGIFLTQYSLFLYMLFDPDWKKTNYLWAGTRIEHEIKYRMKICGVNRMLGRKVDDWGNSKCVFLNKFVRLLRYGLYCYVGMMKIFLKKDKTIVIGQDHAAFARLFLSYYFIVVEDGVANYEEKSKIIETMKRDYPDILKNGLPFGFSDYINEVYLSGRKKVLDETIARKAKIFDIKKIWDKKEVKDKNEIMYIFNYDINEMRKLIKDGRDIFCITGNHSAKNCTEEEQVEMYKEALSGIDLSKVVIKPHPGDKIMYELYFPKCLILRNNFPFEFLYLTNIPLKKIITINSTVGFGLWDDNIVEKKEHLLERILKSKYNNGEKHG